MGTAKDVLSSRAVQANAGSNGEKSRAVQAKAGKREKPERKQRLFGLGNGEGCTVEQSRAGEGRQERKAGAKAEAFLSWERRRVYRRVEPCRRRPAREKSRSESRGFSVLGTAKSVPSSRAVQAKAGKREKPERKQRLFGLGNGEGCTVEQSRAGEGRQERKAGAKAEAFRSWERRRKQSRGGRRPEATAKAYTTHTISMMCCDRILFPIFRSSFFCHMEAMKVYISGQSAVGTEDPAFIAEGIHDLMNGGDDFLIGSVHQHTVTVIKAA